MTRDILRAELERSEFRVLKWMFGIVLGSLGVTAALVTAVTAVVSLLELGCGQSGLVGDWVTAALGGGEVEVHRDLAGNRRVLEVRRGY